MFTRISLAVAVIGALLPGLAAAQQSGDPTGDLALEIGDVSHAVRSSCDGKGGFGGGCATNVAVSGKLDVRWLAEGTRIRSPYGGDVDVSPTHDGAGFEVTVHGLPPLACATITPTRDIAEGIVSVRVGGSADDTTDPIDGSGCMASGGAVDVTWTFR
jgi:hypothetical protein